MQNALWDSYIDWLDEVDIPKLQDEPLSEAGLHRAWFSPTFHPTCCLTVRDCVDVAELELVSSHTPTEEQTLDHNIRGYPKRRWSERVYLEPSCREVFARAMADFDWRMLVDASTDSRDGIGCIGQLRTAAGQMHAFLLYNASCSEAPAQRAWLERLLDLALHTLAEPRSHWMLQQVRRYLGK